MLPTSRLSRRDLFRLGAASAAVSALPAVAHAQPATTPTADLQGAGLYTFKLGDLTVTLISDGGFPMSPAELIKGNATADDVAAAQRDAFLAPGPIPGHVNTLLVRTARDTVLIDTGCGAGFGPTTGKLATNLARAGVQPADVTAVVLTHLHPDHVGGLIAPIGGFALHNAQVFIAPQERAFWSNNPDLSKFGLPELAAAVLGAATTALDVLKDRFVEAKPEAEILPGIRIVALPGHTPGHVGVVLASGGGAGDASLLYLSDALHMPQIQLAHPDWHVAFDTDPVQATATRKRILDRAAADRSLVAGAHLPFPALGHIRADGAGYAWVPAPWQWGA